MDETRSPEQQISDEWRAACLVLSSVLYEVTDDWVWMDTTRGPVAAQKVLDELGLRGYQLERRS